jgi:hypothetical protein
MYALLKLTISSDNYIMFYKIPMMQGKIWNTCIWSFIGPLELCAILHMGHEICTNILTKKNYNTCIHVTKIGVDLLGSYCPFEAQLESM